MENYKRLTLAMLGSATRKAMIVSYLDEPVEDCVSGRTFEMKLDGSLSLPKDAANLCLVMAKFSQANLTPPSIMGMEDLKEYPKTVFNLRSLITAAYPRYVDTDGFKGDNVGILVLAANAFRNDEEPVFIAFGGLGVMLMDGMRMILGEMMTNEEVVLACSNRYIIFFGENDEPEIK